VSPANQLSRIQVAMARAADKAGRDVCDIRLLGVCKGQTPERLQEAYDAGLRDFAENYIQELTLHRALLPKDVRWHCIGPLQSNKVKQLGAIASLQSLHSMKLARKLAQSMEERILPVLIQVNISEEKSKSGVTPQELFALVEDVQTLPELSLEGLMCLPRREEASHLAFARLRRLRDEVQEKTGHSLPQLSMGMSRDFEEAIAQGATMIRVGSKLFGHRTSSDL